MEHPGRRRRASEIAIAYRRFLATRSSSDAPKEPRPVIGRCSCKISILIRKTATAARIVGWNRRRNRAEWGFLADAEDPSSLLGRSAPLMAGSPHLELNGAKLIAVIMMPRRGESRPRARSIRETNTCTVYTCILLCAGNRVCVRISIFSLKNFLLAVFLNFLYTYYIHVIIYLIIYLIIFFY